MSDSPKKLYIIGGQEYGIKDKYIDKLTTLYGNKEEYPDMNSVINFLSVKHLIPIDPTLYVVRYDDNLVSSISASVVQKINKLKFKGTIICLYSDIRSIDKLDKYFPDNTCIVDSVNPKFVNKYLHSDFPELGDRYIQIATDCSTSYGHARTICKSLMHADKAQLSAMNDRQIAELFGCTNESVESDIKSCIAARNFNKGVSLVELYRGDHNNIIYTMLQTMLDLEKILTSKYSDSPIKDYAKFWKLQDIYYFFMNAYSQLSILRSNTSSDVDSSIVYLMGLLTFKDIPSPEVMNDF